MSLVWLGKITADGSSGTITFTSISQSYNRLIVVSKQRGSSTSSSIVNNYDQTWTLGGVVVGSNYATTRWGTYGTIGTDPPADNKWQVFGYAWDGKLLQARSYNSADNMMSLYMEIHNYTSTDSAEKKGVFCYFGTLQTGSDDQFLKRTTSVAIDDAAVDEIEFKLNDGSTYVSGSYWNLYGVLNS